MGSQNSADFERSGSARYEIETSDCFKKPSDFIYQEGRFQIKISIVQIQSKIFLFVFITGNKIQLYGNGFGGGGNGGIPQDAIGQLSALRFTAVKTMEAMMKNMTSLVPSHQSFRVNPVNYNRNS